MTSDRQPIRLRLNATSDSPDNLIEIGGEDIINRVQDITLRAGVGELTTIEVTYGCLEGVRFDGTARVVHRCPLAEDDS